MSARHLVLLAALAVLVTGCGEQSGTPESSASTTPSVTESPESPASSESPSDTPSASLDVPPCSDVWTENAKLPKPYKGCGEGNELVRPSSRPCEFGKSLITYDDQFYAVPGGTIAVATGDLLKDRDYKQVLASCSG